MYGGMYDGHGANYQTVKRHQRLSKSREAAAVRPVDRLPFPLSPLPVGKYKSSQVMSQWQSVAVSTSQCQSKETGQTPPPSCHLIAASSVQCTPHHVAPTLLLATPHHRQPIPSSLHHHHHLPPHPRQPASPDHLKLTREPPSPLKLRRQQFAAEGREFHRATRTSASISGEGVG